MLFEITQQVIFYFFAAVVVLAAFFMITVRNPVTSALLLVLAFFGSAVLWMMLSAEFLALVLVFVYVGAVMTLFLFVLMMLNLGSKYLKGGFVKYIPVAGVIVGCMVAITLYVISSQHYSSGPLIVGTDLSNFVETTIHYSNIKALGEVLYTQYAYPFELAAVLLLVAIIAAISLCHVEKKNRKVQDISRQLRVTREEAFKLVRMKTEHKK